LGGEVGADSIGGYAAGIASGHGPGEGGLRASSRSAAGLGQVQRRSAGQLSASGSGGGEGEEKGSHGMAVHGLVSRGPGEVAPDRMSVSRGRT